MLKGHYPFLSVMIFTCYGLVNFLLAGFNVLLVYLLILELYDRRTASMVVLLLCISPRVYLYGDELYASYVQFDLFPGWIPRSPASP
jgi:hypothetical protein